MRLRSRLAFLPRGLFGLVMSALACSSSRHPAASLGPPVAPTAPSARRAAVPAVALRAPTRRKADRVIVFVWDGLRPDAIDVRVTPNLARLRDELGVNFDDHHSAYPTFTMMNAAAFATGGYAGAHGFFGNTEYVPGASGPNSEGKAIEFTQPVFTEDYGVLRAVDAYQRTSGRRLLESKTLFEAAHEAGFKTAVVGKTGAAYLQDYRFDERLSIVLEENIAAPYEFALALQRKGFALPANAPRFPFAGGRTLTLDADNGTPTAAVNSKLVFLQDGVTPDPRASTGSPHSARNAYLMRAYLEVMLPDFQPELSFIWLRNPDTTEHQFGPGSQNYRAALVDQDRLLGQLVDRVKELGLADTTNLFVVSDHGHSTVAGSASSFPLRALRGSADGHGQVAAIDVNGYSVSGEVRSADWLERAGFRHVYDGNGCVLSPVLSGIRANRSAVYPTRTAVNGACGPEEPGQRKRYSTADYRVPVPPPADAIIIAANGGSEYFYVLDHSREQIEKLVTFFQQRSAYGPIFVHSRHGRIPGTFSMALVRLEGSLGEPPTPDLVVSFDWDAEAVIGGNRDTPGSEYANAQKLRGMHGSFSPIDVHATMIAAGPAFATGVKNRYASGNVDLAPTVAALLGIEFRAPHGRVLSEAFREPTPTALVTTAREHSVSAPIARVCRPDDPPCVHPGRAATYRATLLEKQVAPGPGDAGHSYFEARNVTRE
jgi:arylsulfatase A-like enzyme